MNVTSFALLALMAGAFWFLILRPAKKRQNAAQQLMNELRVGQRVMTTAGMFGHIREVTDDEVSLEVSDGVVVWMLKAAIAKVVEPEALSGSRADASEASPTPSNPAISNDAPKTVSLAEATDGAIDVSKSN